MPRTRGANEDTFLGGLLGLAGQLVEFCRGVFSGVGARGGGHDAGEDREAS